MSSENITKYVYPKTKKKLVACKGCHLIKSIEQFKKEGCENCSKNRENKEVIDFTSDFKGFIAVTDPKKSWVAEYKLHSKDLVPGIYCNIINEEEMGDDDSQDSYNEDENEYSEDFENEADNNNTNEIEYE